MGGELQRLLFRKTGTLTPLEQRYGINATGAGYLWHTTDSRFDANVEPREANRFGWVVEFDPFNPRSTPVKRSALGRLKHEGAWVQEARGTMFVGIQHPGEPASGNHTPNGANPKAISSWPDGDEGERPRSACVVITKDDGGPIGS